MCVLWQGVGVYYDKVCGCILTGCGVCILTGVGVYSDRV